MNAETHFYIEMIQEVVQAIETYTNRFEGVVFSNHSCLNGFYKKLFKEISQGYLADNDKTMDLWLKKSLIRDMSDNEADRYIERFNRETEWGMEEMLAEFQSHWPHLTYFCENYEFENRKIDPIEKELPTRRTEQLRNEVINDFSVKGLPYFEGRLKHWEDKFREEESLIHFPCFPLNNNYTKRLMIVLKRHLMNTEKFFLPVLSNEVIPTSLNEEKDLNHIHGVTSYKDLVNPRRPPLNKNDLRQEQVKRNSTSGKEENNLGRDQVGGKKSSSRDRGVGIKFSSSSIIRPSSSRFQSNFGVNSGINSGSSIKKDQANEKRKKEKLLRAIPVCVSKLENLITRRKKESIWSLLKLWKVCTFFERLNDDIIYNPKRYSSNRSEIIKTSFNQVKRNWAIDSFKLKRELQTVANVFYAIPEILKETRSKQQKVYFQKLKMKALYSWYKIITKKKILVAKFFNRINNNMKYEMKDAWKKFIFVTRTKIRSKNTPSSLTSYQAPTEHWTRRGLDKQKRRESKDEMLVEDYSGNNGREGHLFIPDRDKDNHSGDDVRFETFNGSATGGFGEISPRRNKQEVITGGGRIRKGGEASRERPSDVLMRMFGRGAPRIERRQDDSNQHIYTEIMDRTKPNYYEGHRKDENRGKMKSRSRSLNKTNNAKNKKKVNSSVRTIKGKTPKTDVGVNQEGKTKKREKSINNLKRLLTENLAAILGNPTGSISLSKNSKSKDKTPKNQSFSQDYVHNGNNNSKLAKGPHNGLLEKRRKSKSKSRSKNPSIAKLEIEIKRLRKKTASISPSPEDFTREKVCESCSIYAPTDR